MSLASYHGIRIASLCLSGYWLVLFTGTHLPRITIPKLPHGNEDKYLHFIAFAGLSFLLAWAIPTRLESRWRNLRLAGLLAIFYGAMDELTQIPVGRTADWKDFLADVVGALFGLFCYAICRDIYWRLSSTIWFKRFGGARYLAGESKAVRV